MKYSDLSLDHRTALDDLCANRCETWCKNPTLHQTTLTYFEAFRKGVNAALSVKEEVASISGVEQAISTIREKAKGDDILAQRAWSIFKYFSVTPQQAIDEALTKIASEAAKAASPEAPKDDLDMP